MNFRACKVVLVGEAGVGKTSLVRRFVRNDYKEIQAATIGAAFLCREMKVGEDSLQINIWDTAGAERFHSIAPMYVRGASAVLICYDLTRPQSLDRAYAYVRLIRTQVNEGVQVFMVGCKMDAAAPPYSLPQGLLSASSDKTIHLVSAKEGTGITELFETVARRLIEIGEAPVYPQHGHVVSLDTPETNRCYPTCYH